DVDGGLQLRTGAPADDGLVRLDLQPVSRVAGPTAAQRPVDVDDVLLAVVGILLKLCKRPHDDRRGGSPAGDVESPTGSPGSGRPAERPGAIRGGGRACAGCRR